MARQWEDLTGPELEATLAGMAKTIEKVAEIAGVERPHFALIVFNDPAVGQYICNCERATMIKALRETADRLERNQDIERCRPKGRR